MIIAGNSNVSCFQQKRLFAETLCKEVEVVWVGALTIEQFFSGHPAAEKIRDLFRGSAGWNLLSIGTHDIFDLCKAASLGNFSERFGQIYNNYKQIFSELKCYGSFGWLIFPHPIHKFTLEGMDANAALMIAKQFNRELSQWCLAEGITVIDPVNMILDVNGLPQSRYLQRDKEHINTDAAQFYLTEIEKRTGIRLIFQTDKFTFEPKDGPESFCALLLSGLGIPFSRAISLQQFETKLVEFVSQLLIQKGLAFEADIETELVDSGLLDSLSLVEVYNYAFSILDIEIDFDVDLRSLNTVKKIRDFIFLRHKDKFDGNSVSFGDFLTSLRGDFNNPVDKVQIIEAERHISLMDKSIFAAMLEQFKIVSNNFHCDYGIVYFWFALLAHESGEYETARVFFCEAADLQREFPVDARRIEYYSKLWHEERTAAETSMTQELCDSVPDDTNKLNANNMHSDIGNRRIHIASAKPKISIVTPSFNQAEYLEECIDSILSQNYQNLEYIIMDGGSTDGSVDIIKRYAKHLTYWQSRPDGGQYAAIDDGFRRSTGEIMTWLNSDDKFHPGAFETVASIFSTHEEVQWIMGRPNGFGADGAGKWVLDYLPLWSREKYLNKNYHNPYIQQEGTFWQRSLWEQAGSYMNCSLKLAGDLELWMRFFRHTQLYSVDALLAAYRSHPRQKAALFLDQYNQEAEELLNKERASFDQSTDKVLLPAPLPILVEQKTRDENPIIVSAIVSTYNSEIYMRGCLEDLTGQTLFAAGRLEIVVVDSASPQNEGAIVLEFIGKYGDRIRYIRTDTRETIYQAWNRGIKAAQGKYVTNANTDDRHRADALEQMALTLDANPNVALVYGDSLVTCYPNQTFERHIRCGYHLRPEYQPEIMLSGCHMGPQPMWRRLVHDAVGYFSEQYRSAGDYEFWCRIAGKFKLLHIPQFLGLYYENPRGFANSDASLSVQETISVQHAYADSFPPPTRDYAMNFQYNGDVAANKHVNICLVTRNNLPDLEVVIESLVRYTDYPHVITVADMDSSDGTRDFLLGLKKRGLITNLLLLASDISVADAFAQAEHCEPETGFQLAFGNSIVVGMPGWLSAFVREAQSCAAPFLIGRIWSRDRAIRNLAGILPAYVQEYNLETSCCMKLPARPAGV